MSRTLSETSPQYFKGHLDSDAKGLCSTPVAHLKYRAAVELDVPSQHSD